MRMPVPGSDSSEGDLAHRLRSIEERLGGLDAAGIENLVRAELQAQLSSSDLGTFNPVDHAVPLDQLLVQELVATAHVDEESWQWARRKLTLLTVPEIIAELGWPSMIEGKSAHQDLYLSWHAPGGSYISATVSGGYVTYVDFNTD